MVDPLNVFDRRTLRLHRNRAADMLSEHNFLFQETGKRLVDRIDDIKRQFPLTLNIGCRSGEVIQLLNGRGGVKTIFNAELSCMMARKIGAGTVLVCDEEILPFASGSFDLVLSNLNLHWVNDLPGALIQIRQALKPDGLLLASMLGGNTLQELRLAFYEAEMEFEKGWSPRISPLADVRDLGSILQRTGFALPVADLETITVSYENPLKLMRDLRGMGETNANTERQKTFTRRSTLLRAVEIYFDKFSGEDDRVPATFELITLTAWAPGPGQPKPQARSSAKFSLKVALDP